MTVSVVTRFFVLLLPPTDLLETSGSKDWTGVAGGMTVDGGMPFVCVTDFEDDLADFDDEGNFELGGVFTLGDTLEVASAFCVGRFFRSDFVLTDADDGVLTDFLDGTENNGAS